MRTGVRVAVDWGDVRIGVARCDPAGTLAFPYATIAAGRAEVAELAAVVSELDAVEVLVGLPRTLKGTEGPAAVKARERAARLAAAVPVPVRLVDERLTTVAASRRLREGGHSARQQRLLVDAAAATAILEQALAVERSSGQAPGELLSPASSPGGDPA